MNNPIDRDLEQLEDNLYTVKPHDELEPLPLVFREEEITPQLDELWDGLAS